MSERRSPFEQSFDAHLSREDAPETPPAENAFDDAFAAHEKGADQAAADARATARVEALKTAERSYSDLRDADGKDLGWTEVFLSKEEHTVVDSYGRELKGRELLAWKLHGMKDGKPVSADVLAAAGVVDERIVVVDNKDGGYGYTAARHGRPPTVIAPKPENLIDASIVLHELGHAAQYRDPEFKDLTPLYHAGKGVDFRNAHDRVEAVVEALKDAFDDAAAIRNSPKMVQATSQMIDMQISEDQMLDAQEAGDKAEEKRHRMAVAARRVGVNMALSDALGGTHNAETMANLPLVLMERDATARALTWMRSLRRESGVDLLASEADERGARSLPKRTAAEARKRMSAQERDGGDDRTSAGADVDAASFLRDSLATHGARKSVRQALRLMRSEAAEREDANKRLAKDLTDDAEQA